MKHRSELEYFRRVLAKGHLRTVLLGEEPVPADMNPDFFCWPTPWAKPNTIYKLLDGLDRRYIFLLLPEGGALAVGPWLDEEPASPSGLHPTEAPVIRDTTLLFNMVNVLGETLWGSDSAFTILDVTRDPVPEPPLTEEVPDPVGTLQHLRLMEQRYAYENELMETVAQGLEHRAELMLRGFSQHIMEQRSADPVRNAKNYCIVCNTLLRKAAEQGGVHPAELDRTSSRLARRVEEQGTAAQALEMIQEMVRAYCRLVRHRTAAGASPFVRRTMTYIEADPGGDLSLHNLAALLNINASYLSTLFHRETGRTVTDFVNSTRMEAAARLLRTSQLQIQAVAQHCGMSDVNYFSKLFKKHHGVTPRQFRELHPRYMQK